MSTVPGVHATATPDLHGSRPSTFATSSTKIRMPTLTPLNLVTFMLVRAMLR